MNLLTLAQAAQSLRISLRTLQREIAAGRIAVVEIRGAVRLAESDLAEYVVRSKVTRAQQCPSSDIPKPVTGMSAYRSAASESSALLDRLLEKKTPSPLRRRSAASTSTAGSAKPRRAA